MLGPEQQLSARAQAAPQDPPENFSPSSLLGVEAKPHFPACQEQRADGLGLTGGLRFTTKP